MSQNNLANIDAQIQLVETIIDYMEQTLIPQATTPAEVDILQAVRQILYTRLYALEIAYFMNS